MPRRASLAIAESRNAGFQYLIERLKPRPPSPLSAWPYSRRTVRRSSRVSLCSVSRKSPNCTGDAVCCTGIVPPFGIRAADGVPGRRSDRQLPSRKILGGTLADAPRDRKSTRLNSSHANTSYAVFLPKKLEEQK